MRMMLASILLLMSSVLAFARIGETPQECIDRYGQPVKGDPSTDETIGFVKTGFIIVVHFFEGTADIISFAKVEKDILDRSKDLSETEIASLLSSNGQKRKWIKQVGILDSDWQTDDESLFAHYDYSTHILSIATKGYMDRAMASKKAEEEKNLGGF